MTAESKGFDPYDAVIADLRSKREQIDQAIQLIESLRGGMSIPGVPQSSSAPTGSESALGPGAFLGMSIPDATKKLLRVRKQALGNAEIVQALKAGGMAMESQDPVNTVGSVLTRRFNTQGDIVRVARGTWGLAEWYPGRSFNKKKGGQKNGEGESEKADEDARLAEELP
ncbi:MAG: winged helix-turn-helix domain-containing protein [Hyphomicrobiales bacterium]